MEKKFLMIDGSSLLFRAFYAIRNLKTNDGIHTNGVYGFLSMFYKAVDLIKPNYIMVAFDEHGPTFRSKEYSEYKGTRQETPEELRPQFGIVREILEAMDVKHLSSSDFEADDIIGSMSKICEKENIKSFLLTGDRDYFQLASEKTKVLYTVKGISNLEEIDKDRIKEKYGLLPEELIDVKGLMGDKSDNIPGVPGIGEKTAIKLIKEYKTIENIYKNIDGIKGKKLKENLVDNEDIAFLSKRLGTIYRNMDMGLAIEDFKYSEGDKKKLAEIFSKLEFNSFKEKLGLEVEIDDIKTNIKFFDEKKDKKALEEKLKRYVEDENKGKIYFKSLSDSSLYIHAKPLFTVVKLGEDDISYIFDLSKDAEFLKKLLESKLEKYTFDLKEDMVILKKIGIEISEPNRDLMIMEYLIDPSRTRYDISDLASKYMDLNIKSKEDYLGSGKKMKSFDNLDREELFKYLGDFINILEKTEPEIEASLRDRDMLDLYFSIENRLIEVLASMEEIGFSVDADILGRLEKDFNSRIEDLTEKIYSEASVEFNINSPKQLGEILFEKLSYPPIKKTKTGYSTNVEVLEKLKSYGPLPDLILQYRSLTKLMNTYVDGLRKVIDSDGRVRSTFKQNVAATGRLSSQDPNLQNIPIRSEDGRALRKAFVAKEGFKLIDADYSQIELRLLAHLAEDKKMIGAFNDGVDIHTKTASEVFKVPLDEVTKLQRSNAKAVNFGIVYGISDYGLSQDLNISRKEAKEYIDNYLDTYPNIREYMDKVVKDAKKKGYVETIFHRRRYIPELSSKNYTVRSFGERIALNAPIQGSAADIIKIAMIRVYDELKRRKLKSKLILQIHDELIIEAPEDEVDEVKTILVDLMESCVDLSLQLKVDAKIGDNWYEAH